MRHEKEEVRAPVVTPGRATLVQTARDTFGDHDETIYVENI